MRFSFLMSWLAIVSIILAVADVELTVVRQPQQALTLLFGSCRTPRPSLLVRSGHSFASIADVMEYAPRAMPASPAGALGFGQSWVTNAQTGWADVVNASAASFCGADSRLPAGTGNEPCSADSDRLAAILLGVADRQAELGMPSLTPRSWALMLGTHRDCLAGTRAVKLTSFGGSQLPTAADMAAARGSDLSEAAAAAVVGVATWPVSGSEGAERTSVLLPSSRLVALEALSVSMAAAVLAEQGTIPNAASGLLSETSTASLAEAWAAMNATTASTPVATAAGRIWAHAFARIGLSTPATFVEVLEMSASVQPSASLRGRALQALAASASASWPSQLGLSVVGSIEAVNSTARLRTAAGHVAPEAFASLVFPPEALTGLSGDSFRLFGDFRSAKAASSVLPSDLWGTAQWMGRGGFGGTPMSLVPDSAAAAAAMAAGIEPGREGAGAGLDLTAAEVEGVRAAGQGESLLVGAAWAVRAAQSAVTVVLCALAVLWHLKSAQVRQEKGQTAPGSGLCRLDHAASDVACGAWVWLAAPCSREVCNGCVRSFPRLCPERAAELARRDRRHLQLGRRIRASLIVPERQPPLSAPGGAVGLPRAGGIVADEASKRRSHKHTLREASLVRGSLCQWSAAGEMLAELLMIAVHMPVAMLPQAESVLGPSLFVAVALAPAILRVHLPMRLAFLTSDLGTGGGRLIVALSGQTFSASFFVKLRLREQASATVLTIMIFFVTFAAVGLHATESLSCSAERVPPCVPLALGEALYLVAISITTVGFGGRYAPRTAFGAVLVVLACGMSLAATAVAVAELVRFMNHSPAEEQVTSLSRKAGIRTARKHLAAAAIQAAWHWSMEHRQSLLWTRNAFHGLVFRSSASRAAATLRATGSVAKWAAFRTVAGRSMLDADMGPRRRLLAAFSHLRVEEAKELLEECMAAAASATSTVAEGLSPELRALVGLPAEPGGAVGTQRGPGESEEARIPSGEPGPLEPASGLVGGEHEERTGRDTWERQEPVFVGAATGGVPGDRAEHRYEQQDIDAMVEALTKAEAVSERLRQRIGHDA